MPSESRQNQVPQWIPIFGAVLLFLLLVFLGFLVFLRPELTSDQRQLIQLMFSLAAGVAASVIGGAASLKYDLNVGKHAKVSLTATAGIAVFLAVYLLPPWWEDGHEGRGTSPVPVYDAPLVEDTGEELHGFLRQHEGELIKLDTVLPEDFFHTEAEIEELIALPADQPREVNVKYSPNEMYVNLSLRFTSASPGKEPYLVRRTAVPWGVDIVGYFKVIRVIEGSGQYIAELRPVSIEDVEHP